MIDRIEYNVSQAVNYVQDAVVNTNKALKYQRSARRVSDSVSILCNKTTKPVVYPCFWEC